MGMISSKDVKIDEATSNTSLSNLRYVTTEKPKWKVFKKRVVTPIPMYQTGKARKGCPCGNNSPCKQKVTPKGVTIHYPQKAKKFGNIGAFGRGRRYKPPKIDKGYLSSNREPTKVKIVRPKKFPIPTWRLDKLLYHNPYKNNINRGRRGRRLRRGKAKTLLIRR